jgi:hypothetical protein
VSAAISAHRSAGAAAARIDRIDYAGDRIELRLRLGDGSRATATFFDDGVNSAELAVGGTVFVRPAVEQPQPLASPHFTTELRTT